MATRAEHVTWVKARAMQELDADPNGRGPTNAMASVTSDLRKHPETDGHAAIELMFMLAMGGHLTHASDVRKFIDGIQ